MALGRLQRHLAASLLLMSGDRVLSGGSLGGVCYHTLLSAITVSGSDYCTITRAGHAAGGQVRSCAVD